ncbi:Rv1535 domain-containing protein [Mycobacterium asiaticum]|uniref:Rv1535 domain-containing protein n=1 Tax=Mycobacterium asiaticum TaxID=1790 RepID=UPI0009BF485F|nr:Rv1535 domain-containing protein [Mycobacterium asiaticum]
MTTTDHPADPLVSSFAALLKGPLTELYALLWRVGVLEVATTANAPRGTSQDVDRAAAPRSRRVGYRQATG